MKAFVPIGALCRALIFVSAALAGILSPLAVVAQQQPPNILVIMGDDIGYWNISAYNRGQMGYRTPNIDRIANEGAILTDYYGQQSCTAGRAAFITGQSPMRTGKACHGPGSRHVAWAGSAEKAKPTDGPDKMGLTNWLKPTDHGNWEMNPQTGISRRTEKLASIEVETCAAFIPAAE